MGAQPSCKVLLCPWCKEEGHTDPVTVPVPLGTLEEMHCEEHGEKVCFFCGHDAQLLCTRCREGPSHHTHAVGFLDGACQPNQSCRNFNSSLRGPSVMDAKNHLSHHPVTRSASDFSEAPLGSLTRPHPHNRHQVQALSASPRHWTASDVLPASTLSVSDHPPTLHEDGVRTQLEALRVEGEEIEDIKSREDQKFQMLLTHIEIRKQQVEAVFEKLQQELREQRGLLLARLRELEVQVCEEREGYISKFSEEVARHRAEAEELENCQQLDVGVSQSRCEKTFVSPETISPALVKKIRDVHRKILPLPEMLRTFSESLVHHLETDSGAGTRDPPAASWSTALSEDRKPTRFTRDQQDLPHCPWSSEGVPLALGCPGGTSGRPRGHVQVQPRARGGRPNTVYDEPARR
ncbi:tripartite motif-containing protein 15-like [Prionailurus viverrinus]|uniref:tripartite motif-containing protein 15-like n=1 Tax=Prionailurus viverrinus TaxID=61388 RepID=UPI001FF3F3F1|nr:tripartite motif-containing protein 15-like [Prionailurus viverrinus]